MAKAKGQTNVFSPKPRVKRRFKAVGKRHNKGKRK